MTSIAPSILAADFAHLADQVEQVVRGGVSMLHVDVMDGHFVPNISIGVPVVRSLRSATDLTLDCHLMITEPDRYIGDFIAAGADIVTVHQEACPHLDRTLRLIRASGAKAGVALNPATPIHTLDEALSIADLVLVMSVNPGFGGQTFIPASLNKIRRLAGQRSDRRLDFQIEVDGGVDSSNAADLSRAGADILVAGSSIFGTQNPTEAVENMRDAVERAGLLRA